MNNLPNKSTIRIALTAGAILPLALLSDAVQAGQWRSGQELYEKICGRCHKPEVGVGLMIQGRGLPVEYVRTIVRNGFNAMPAFPASFIDDEAIVQVTEYIAGLPFVSAEQP